MLHFFKSVRYRTPVRFRTFIRTVHFPFYPPSKGESFPRIFVPPLHSFGRSRGNAHLRHSFGRSSEVEHGQNGCTECCGADSQNSLLPKEWQKRAVCLLLPKGLRRSGCQGRHRTCYSSSRMMESLMKRREGGMERRPLRRMREPVARRRSIEVRRGRGS